MIVLPAGGYDVAVGVEDPPSLVGFPRGQHEFRLVLAGACHLHLSHFGNRGGRHAGHAHSAQSVPSR